MDMKGEYRIPAPRDQVWAALNDPEILRQSIPGCEELTKHSDTELEAKVTAKVGPVKAKFAGNVQLQNINAPVSYSIVGEGKGGAAGFAKGGADVHLADDGEDTVLTYEAKAEVGGKLAQIGSRLVQGTAKKMADEFFGNFSRIVGEAGPAATAARDAAAREAPKPEAAEPEAAEPAPAAAAEGATEAAARAAPAPPPADAIKEQTAAKASPSPRSSTPPSPAPAPAGGEQGGAKAGGGLGMPAYIGIGVVVLILLYLVLT